MPFPLRTSPSSWTPTRRVKVRFVALYPPTLLSPPRLLEVLLGLQDQSASPRLLRPRRTLPIRRSRRTFRRSRRVSLRPATASARTAPSWPAVSAPKQYGLQLRWAPRPIIPVPSVDQSSSPSCSPQWIHPLPPSHNARGLPFIIGPPFVPRDLGQPLELTAPHLVYHHSGDSDSVVS